MLTESFRTVSIYMDSCNKHSTHKATSKYERVHSCNGLTISFQKTNATNMQLSGAQYPNHLFSTFGTLFSLKGMHNFLGVSGFRTAPHPMRARFECGSSWRASPWFPGAEILVAQVVDLDKKFTPRIFWNLHIIDLKINEN